MLHIQRHWCLMSSHWLPIYWLFDVYSLTAYFSSINCLMFINWLMYISRLKLTSDLDLRRSHHHHHPECITCEGPCKFVSAKFSPSGLHYIEGCLGPDVPQYSLKSTKHNKGQSMIHVRGGWVCPILFKGNKYNSGQSMIHLRGLWVRPILKQTFDSASVLSSK